MAETGEEEEPAALSVFDMDFDDGATQQPVTMEAIRLSDEVEIEIEAASVQVWGSARYLASWLLTPDGHATVAGQCVLEVGAGLGLPSIACAIAGAARAMATDKCAGSLEALCRLRDLRYKDTDWARRVETMSLDWADCLSVDFHPLMVADVVLAADCHYYSAALKPLVATIQPCSATSGPGASSSSRAGRAAFRWMRAGRCSWTSVLRRFRASRLARITPPLFTKLHEFVLRLEHYDKAVGVASGPDRRKDETVMREARRGESVPAGAPLCHLLGDWPSTQARRVGCTEDATSPPWPRLAQRSDDQRERH
mmetsp:Transcript_79088/g.219754  ORF Transcript_79088/g.219754 Transcript_79088/m.219754 type:complete len:311 (+) Transcript_79088:114-1046(+)